MRKSQEAEAGKFKPGDLVKLKSGGPKMTVKSQNALGHEENFQCQWFAGHKLESGFFPGTSLIAAEESETDTTEKG